MEISLEPLITLLSVVFVIGLAILFWIKTPAGKKWLRDL